MKYLKAILFIVLASVSFNVTAQATTENNTKKDNSRARIENVRGEKVLVLKAGHNKTIDLKIETDTWRQLDSIVAGPWGNAIKLQDVDGYKVDVAKANVNSKVGLMFTSGTKCVAVTKEEYEALKL